MSEFPDAIDSVDEPGGGYPDACDFHERSFADMIERLFQQFDDRLPLPTIVQVVRKSREQLRGSPAGAMPELTERLAIARLTALSEPRTDDASELAQLDAQLDVMAPAELPPVPAEAALAEPGLATTVVSGPLAAADSTATQAGQTLARPVGADGLPTVAAPTATARAVAPNAAANSPA